MKKFELTHQEISSLCMGLSLFLRAGVDAGSGLALLAKEERAPYRQSMLLQLACSMDEGASLSHALRETGKFPSYVCSLIGVGEETGHTEEALGALAQYYEQRARMDRQLRTALLYPSLLLLIMLAVITVLLTRVLPVFDEVYSSLGGRLTGLAGGLLSLGQALDRLLPLLCLLLGAAVLLLVLFACSHSFRAKLLRLWRRLLGDRGVSRKLNSARFAQALSMGLSGGLPLEDAFDLAASLLEDVPSARERCTLCRTMLDQGETLTRAMGESELLPRSECRLLELGMRSGNQEKVMGQIALRLSEEGEAALQERVGQVEPALVVTTSLMVGVILLSVMLPLMNIMTAIG